MKELEGSAGLVDEVESAILGDKLDSAMESQTKIAIPSSSSFCDNPLWKRIESNILRDTNVRVVVCNLLPPFLGPHPYGPLSVC